MTTTHTSATLQTLPRELRDIIYDFTFTSVARRSNYRSPDNTPANCNAGLLMTCHQIHAEAIIAYYKNTIFATTPGGIMWYTELPTNYRELVHEIRIWSNDWEQVRPVCRLQNLERLGQGILAILKQPIDETLLKTYFGEGGPSKEEMEEYEGTQWKFVPNLPYRELLQR